MSAIDRIRPAIAGLATEASSPHDGIALLETSVANARELVSRLRHACGFELCTFVTAVDRFPADPRFEVLWQLQSIAHEDRVRVRARVGDGQSVPTIVDLYPGAAFSERECFDMFGVVFEGHPGLKRLLMPDGYDHYPLRKDFPHQGIEPDRLYREWDRQRHLGQGVP